GPEVCKRIPPLAVGHGGALAGIQGAVRVLVEVDGPPGQGSLTVVADPVPVLVIPEGTAEVPGQRLDAEVLSVGRVAWPQRDGVRPALGLGPLPAGLEVLDDDVIAGVEAGEPVAAVGVGDRGRLADVERAIAGGVEEYGPARESGLARVSRAVAVSVLVRDAADFTGQSLGAEVESGSLLAFLDRDVVTAGPGGVQVRGEDTQPGRCEQPREADGRAVRAEQCGRETGAVHSLVERHERDPAVLGSADLVGRGLADVDDAGVVRVRKNLPDRANRGGACPGLSATRGPVEAAEAHAPGIAVGQVDRTRVGRGGRNRVRLDSCRQTGIRRRPGVAAVGGTKYAALRGIRPVEVDDRREGDATIPIWKKLDVDDVLVLVGPTVAACPGGTTVGPTPDRALLLP